MFLEPMRRILLLVPLPALLILTSPASRALARDPSDTEMLTLIDAAVHRGEKIKKIMPDFLEGVTL